MLEADNFYSFDYFQISWAKWIVISLFVICMVFVIRLLHNSTAKMSSMGGWKKVLNNIIFSVFVLSEPIALLIIVIAFILIHPIVHGILIAFIFLLAFTIIKSYFLGKVLQLENECYTGQKIKFKDTEGFIKNIGGTSLTIQTELGAKHVSYAQIFSEGFTKLQGKEVGGLQSIYVDTSDTDQNTIQNIKDRLWESPYLDWSFEPEVTITNKKNQFEVKVLLNEKKHLDDLINLISEWGYQCHVKI